MNQKKHMKSNSMWINQIQRQQFEFTIIMRTFTIANLFIQFVLCNIYIERFIIVMSHRNCFSCKIRIYRRLSCGSSASCLRCKCILKSCLYSNAAGHRVHLNFLTSPRCRFSCTRQWSLRLKRLSQNAHANAGSVFNWKKLQPKKNIFALV